MHFCYAGYASILHLLLQRDLAEKARDVKQQLIERAGATADLIEESMLEIKSYQALLNKHIFLDGRQSECEKHMKLHQTEAVQLLEKLADNLEEQRMFMFSLENTHIPINPTFSPFYEKYGYIQMRKKQWRKKLQFYQKIVESKILAVKPL
jgi:hypothetical protein